MVKTLRKFKKFYLKALPMNGQSRWFIAFILVLVWTQKRAESQELGAMWGTAEEEKNTTLLQTFPFLQEFQ